MIDWCIKECHLCILSFYLPPYSPFHYTTLVHFHYCSFKIFRLSQILNSFCVQHQVKELVECPIQYSFKTILNSGKYWIEFVSCYEFSGYFKVIASWTSFQCPLIACKASLDRRSHSLGCNGTFFLLLLHFALSGFCSGSPIYYWYSCICHNSAAFVFDAFHLLKLNSAGSNWIVKRCMTF